MKRLWLLASLLCLAVSPALAAEHTSVFGIKIDVPSDWLVISAKEAKDNADLIEGNLRTAGGEAARFSEQVMQAIRAGNMEMFVRQTDGDAAFNDNVNLTKHFGRLPAEGEELQRLCAAIPEEFARAFGHPAAVIRCEFAKVGALPALLLEFDGALVGTRSVQYQIQLTPATVVGVTLTSKLATLPQTRPQFEQMIESIRPVAPAD